MSAVPQLDKVQEALGQLRPSFPKKSMVELLGYSPTLMGRVRNFLDSKGWEVNEAFLHCWKWHGRPQQFAPIETDWDVWLILAGRGFGKTRTGAEWVREQILSGKAKRVALIGRTAADVRDVMIFGPSGIMSCCAEWERPTWEPSKRQLTWHDRNGKEIAICKCYSADNPDQLRGPQHDAAWADEICAWKYADAWDQLQLGLRLGTKPRCVVTTTPRTITLLKTLLHRAKPNAAGECRVRVTNGDTRDNRRNMAASYMQSMEEQFRGTRLGRQELEGLMLEDLKGPLWSLTMLDTGRVEFLSDNHLEWGRMTGEGERYRVPVVPILRTVIGVDPAITSSAHSDETGIVAAGLGADGHAYVLGDYSCKKTPEQYCLEILNAYDTHRADAIVIETNRGGEAVIATLNLTCANLNRPVPRIIDLNSQQGKVGRAEPIFALYEQGRVHHYGTHRELEDEMCGWDPQSGKSPNRVDALVFAVAELIPSIRPPAPTGKRVQAQEGHFSKTRQEREAEGPRRSRWRRAGQQRRQDGWSRPETLVAIAGGRARTAASPQGKGQVQVGQAELRISFPPVGSNQIPIAA